MDLVELVGPFLTALEPGQHEQQGELEEQKLAVDERIDGAFPPARLPTSVRAEPIVIGSPMARFVLLDDPEDPRESRVTSDNAMAQQDLDLTVAAFLG
jgi:hypothetical protein